MNKIVVVVLSDTNIVICFFCGDLSVASVTLIGFRYTETVSELQQQQYVSEQPLINLIFLTYLL